MKLLWALTLTAGFVVLLLVVYVLHTWYFPVRVVLYSALLDVGLALVIMVAVLLLLGRARLPFNGFETTLLIVVWLLGGYGFAVSFPTVLDRSLSFYLLEKLEQRGGGIKEARIADVFVREYLPEMRLVDVRLTEQVESGSIVVEDGCVKLTDRGRRLAHFSRIFRNHLLPRQRLLAGEYTDALIHPFKDSPAGEMGYECD